jgi:hypothetical protein
MKNQKRISTSKSEQADVLQVWRVLSGTLSDKIMIIRQLPRSLESQHPEDVNKLE